MNPQEILNFALTSERVPKAELVTATESGCRNLRGRDANELRAKL